MVQLVRYYLSWFWNGRVSAPAALALICALLGPRTGACAQEPAPAGLAATALEDSTFSWVDRETPGFRVHFLAGSFAAEHQDSLLIRLPYGLQHAESMIDVPALRGPLDVFFVQSRVQMTRLVGMRATGFAQPSARAVFLMTNAEWRSFERHEIMHVVAGQAWGPPGPNSEWLEEGLAQAADGSCGGFSNSGVLLALSHRHGLLPMTDVLLHFREQPDLRAYLQAAVFVDYLLQAFGPEALRPLWQGGVTVTTEVHGRSISALERDWRSRMMGGSQPNPDELTTIESCGCGVGPAPELPTD